MDHIGETMTPGTPTDHVQIGMSIPGPDCASVGSSDIDLPLTATAQYAVELCALYAETSRDPSLDLVDHLFRAFRDTPGNTVADLMDEDGLPTPALVACLNALVGGDWNADRTRLPALRLERVIIRAKREAWRRRHDQVSCLHLLLGLAREQLGAVVYDWETFPASTIAD